MVGKFSGKHIAAFGAKDRSFLVDSVSFWVLVMEHSPTNKDNSTSQQNSETVKENFERHLAAVASIAAAAAASNPSNAVKSNSSFLIEDILFPRKSSDESNESTEEKSNSIGNKNGSENTANTFGSDLALSQRLNEYGNLAAAYFTSHAAAAMASTSTGGFLQQHGGYLTKTHTPIPSPFFLPTGKNVFN